MKTFSPLAKRISISKTLGFILGLIVFLSTSDLSMTIRFGLLLYITLFGGVVGLMGFLTHHPIWKEWKLSWWFRGAMMGFFFALVLTLLMEPTLRQMLQNYGFGSINPYWSLLEWAIW